MNHVALEDLRKTAQLLSLSILFQLNPRAVVGASQPKGNVMPNGDPYEDYGGGAYPDQGSGSGGSGTSADAFFEDVTGWVFTVDFGQINNVGGGISDYPEWCVGLEDSGAIDYAFSFNVTTIRGVDQFNGGIGNTTIGAGYNPNTGTYFYGGHVFAGATNLAGSILGWNLDNSSTQAGAKGAILNSLSGVVQNQIDNLVGALQNGSIDMGTLNRELSGYAVTLALQNNPNLFNGLSAADVNDILATMGVSVSSETNGSVTVKGAGVQNDTGSAASNLWYPEVGNEAGYGDNDPLPPRPYKMEIVGSKDPLYRDANGNLSLTPAPGYLRTGDRYYLVVKDQYGNPISLGDQTNGGYRMVENINGAQVNGNGQIGSPAIQRNGIWVLTDDIEVGLTKIINGDKVLVPLTPATNAASTNTLSQQQLMAVQGPDGLVYAIRSAFTHTETYVNGIVTGTSDTPLVIPGFTDQ